MLHTVNRPREMVPTNLQSAIVEGILVLGGYVTTEVVIARATLECYNDLEFQDA